MTSFVVPTNLAYTPELSERRPRHLLPGHLPRLPDGQLVLGALGDDDGPRSFRPREFHLKQTWESQAAPTGWIACPHGSGKQRAHDYRRI